MNEMNEWMGCCTIRVIKQQLWIKRMNDTLSQWEKQNIKANDRSEKVLKCERQLEQTYSILRVCCVGQHIYNNNNIHAT